MTRVLIPRGPCCSAKTVSSTDFESYFSDIINDYIVTGFCLAAQCPNILAANIATGKGRQCGLYVENTITCSVTCLAACMTTFVYIQLNRDAMCRPCNFTFATNTTGCAPCEAQVIGSATTNCSTVTSVDNTLKQLEAITDGSPTGSITMFGGTLTTIPTGWLLADGSTRSTTTCARLFDVIGFQFGGMCCCFCLPDLQAKFSRGAPACCQPGGTGGVDAVTLTGNQSGVQTHVHGGVHDALSCGTTIGGACHIASATSNTGGVISAPISAICSHTNIPAFVAMLYIIKT